MTQMTPHLCRFVNYSVMIGNVISKTRLRTRAMQKMVGGPSSVNKALLNLVVKWCCWCSFGYGSAVNGTLLTYWMWSGWCHVLRGCIKQRKLRNVLASVQCRASNLYYIGCILKNILLSLTRAPNWFTHHCFSESHLLHVNGSRLHVARMSIGYCQIWSDNLRWKDIHIWNIGLRQRKSTTHELQGDIHGPWDVGVTRRVSVQTDKNRLHPQLISGGGSQPRDQYCCHNITNQCTLVVYVHIYTYVIVQWYFMTKGKYNSALSPGTFIK